MTYELFTEKQINEIIDLLVLLDNNTKVYIGTDSIRYKKNDRWYAKYATVCIVHMNGKNGCKVFSVITHEPDFDLKKNRPKTRMMNEVIKSCQAYIQLSPFIDCYDVELHCDINTDPKHGSNCAASEAAGYVLGATGITPKLKPNAWCASFGSDWAVHGKSELVK